MPSTEPAFKKSLHRRHVFVGIALIALTCTALLLWQDVPRRAYRRTKNALIGRGYFLPTTTPAFGPVEAARYNLPLRTLDGKNLSLEAFRGKVILLNVWASWCPPCRGEMAGINQLYREAGSQVAFVLLSVDKNRKQLDHYLAREGYHLPVYLPDSALATPYRTQSIPATFLINRQGQIVLRHEGALDFTAPAFREKLALLTSSQ